MALSPPFWLFSVLSVLSPDGVAPVTVGFAVVVTRFVVAVVTWVFDVWLESEHAAASAPSHSAHVGRAEERAVLRCVGAMYVVGGKEDGRDRIACAPRDPSVQCPRAS